MKNWRLIIVSLMFDLFYYQSFIREPPMGLGHSLRHIPVWWPDVFIKKPSPTVIPQTSVTDNN